MSHDSRQIPTTWLDALERQELLQKCLAHYQGECAVPQLDELELALKVELGELLQNIKERWAWWKRNDKTFADAQRANILEELADILHFVLGAVLLRPQDSAFVSDYPIEETDEYDGPKPNLIDKALALFNARRPAQQFVGVLELARALDVSTPELFDAYMRKSEINLKRWDASECLPDS